MLGNTSTYLLKLEVLPLGKLNLIPHDFHALLGVHGQVGAVDPGDVALVHLHGRDRHTVSLSRRDQIVTTHPSFEQ